MQEEIERVLADVFTPPHNEGPSKLVSLQEAVASHVKPGMALYFPFTITRGPYCSVYEITRQFWGKPVKFDLLSPDIGGPFVALFAGGMVRKVITSFLASPYYYPAPCPVYQKAIKDGVEIEHCSLFTFAERTRAGAMGLPFLPTRSLIGSTMAEENRDTVQIVEDPFGSKQKLALVKAIVPDLAIVHGWAADEYGNTIVLPPYGDGYYGALGARNGVVVTVEKVVSTDFIRKYSAFVKIPGHMVRSVSRVPLGAHPAGMYDGGLADFEGYLEDYDYYAMLHRAGKDPKKFQQWLDEWVLGCPDHEAYLRKLGSERIQFLKGRANPDSWRFELNCLSGSLSGDRPFNQLEMLIAAAARKLAEKAEQKDYKTLIAGAGLALLAGGLARYMLQEKQRDVEMLVETGLYGVCPRPAEPFLISHLHFPTCKILTDISTQLGIFMGGANSRCLGMLGAAQVDKWGNVNTTRIGGTHIIGSGGSNDISSAAREAVVLAIQTPGRVVERVEYITSPGKNVTALVTNLGVFEKLDGRDCLVLTGYFPDERLTPRQRIENIKANTGWDLEVSPRVAEVPAPTPHELLIIRLLDPAGYHIGKQIESRLKP